MRRAQGQLQRQELKVFDTALSFDVDSTGEVPATGQLCLIQTGDTLNNRDGAVVQVKSLQLRFQFVFTPGASASASALFTIYVILDRQANGAAAAVTDVLTSTNCNTALGNVPNQYRFKVLRKLQFALPSQAGVTTAYNNVVVGHEEYIKFNTPIELRYTASTGAISDLASNNIFLIAGANTASDDLINVAGTARLRFTG